MSATSTLRVWDCRKCAKIRSAPCGGVCLPSDYVSAESTHSLAEHPAAHHAWVAYAVSQGHDRDEVEQMTTNQLIAEFGASL